MALRIPTYAELTAQKTQLNKKISIMEMRLNRLPAGSEGSTMEILMDICSCGQN